MIIAGKRFGRWTVLGLAISTEKDGRRRWVCKCDCGTVKDIAEGSLRSANSRSCGCLRVEELIARVKTHGQSTRGGRTSEYDMWKSARHRALLHHLPFNIELTDIVVPQYCPVLNIKLDKTHSKSHDDSPSLDRLVPSLGYIKGNVCVISHRANSIKSNATWQELLSVSEWVKKETAWQTHSAL